MTRPLTLVRHGRPTLPLSAGWLASPDPREWLRELAHCRAQGCEVALYPVARSAADPRVAGVLLLPRRGVPRFRPRVQALAEIAPGVHAPPDAALSAGLLENEREFFFPYRVHFFHPALGLTGFDPKDELAPAKLLERPPERGLRWNLALPVARFDPQLKSIVVAEPPDPAEMLAEASREIGDQSGKPPQAGSSLLDKAGLLGKGLAGGTLLGAGWVLGTLGKAADFIYGQGPAGKQPATPGSLDQLRRWAEKNWQQLVDSRSREIDRLMKLMETDPDQGLRYALPLAGIEQSRGVAAPSWKLGMNNTRFSLGHGGGAIDGWDIANEARLKLERQYRDAAKREIALGRHERAAYIFGNLLGDWPSAAKALADGGRHRDAVAIYLHKLNNRPAAAKCLEDAGLLLQAAAAYAECKQFEKAGDLHARLGNDAQARELWLAAKDAHPDRLERARILADKLGERAAALELLELSWVSGDRPEAALAAMFAIHREDQAAAAALALLSRMFEQPVASLPLAAKLKLGHAEAARWSDPALATELEKQAYRRIGRALSTGGGDSAALLAFLPQLDPADRLLARDAKRFSLRKNPPKVPKSGPPQGTLRPEQVIEISKGVRWDSIATLPKGVSFAGYGKDMLAVGQLRDNGCHSSALRTTDDPGNTQVRHLVATSSRGSSRLFHFPAFGRLHYRALDRARTAEDDALGTLRNVLAAGPHGDEGDFAILDYTNTSSLSVHIYSEAAALRRSIPIDLAPPDVTFMNWRIAGHGGHLCLAAAGFVAWRYPDGQFATMNLGESPASLHLSPLSPSSEALIPLFSDVLLIEVPKPGRPLETVNLFSDPDADGPPVCCYLPDGSIVIAHRGGGVIYPPGDRVKASATLVLPTDAGFPVDLCPRGNGGFAILTDAGKLLVFAG
jgi:tetratricopeptide (TPR) repeat protein